MAIFKWDGILYELIFVLWIFSHLKIQCTDKVFFTNYLRAEKTKVLQSLCPFQFFPLFLRFFTILIYFYEEEKN